jgi:hypothetical protein
LVCFQSLDVLPSPVSSHAPSPYTVGSRTTSIVSMGGEAHRAFHNGRNYITRHGIGQGPLANSNPSSRFSVQCSTCIRQRQAGCSVVIGASDAVGAREAVNAGAVGEPARSARPSWFWIVAVGDGSELLVKQAYSAQAHQPNNDRHVVTADGNDMGRACRTKGILHAMGYAGIIAKQDAREERRLRFRHAERLRDDVLSVRRTIQYPVRRRAETRLTPPPTATPPSPPSPTCRRVLAQAQTQTKALMLAAATQHGPSPHAAAADDRLTYGTSYRRR